MKESFGRYVLLKRIAVGGMAEIFLSSLKSEAGFSKTVVVKRILPNFGSDPDFVNMFINEAVVAAKLTHPNIVTTYDFGVIDGSYFIAMEYVEGVDLSTLFKLITRQTGSIEPYILALIGEGCARGLAYAHYMSNEDGTPACIVHRDISPHNIMLSTEGELKIMDFGIAKTAAQFGRTLTGTIKGKLGYMAPEQAAGQVATAASDQFSLGIVLWELATRQRLFTGKTDADIIQAVKLCQIPDLGLMRPDIPSAIRRVIMRMLAENPKDRFQGLQWVQEACMQARIKIEGKGASTLKDFARMHHMLALKQLSQQNWSLAAGNIPSVGTRVISGRKKTSSQVQRFTEKLFPIWVQNFTWKNIFPMTLNFIKKNAQAILKALLWGAMPASVLLFYLDNMHPGIAQELFYGVAFVNIDSPLTPLDVYNGEEYLGTTPVKNLNLPANDIELQLKHPSTHKMMEYPVHLKDEQKYYFIIGEKEIKLLR